MATLTIGQLAKKAKVNLETIRYYERRGLIPEPPRNKSGHRVYSQEAVRRMGFIKRCQAHGFSLKEVSELLALRVGPDTTCGDVKARIERKITDIEKRIADLQKIKEALLRMSGKCVLNGPVGECPILEELYK